MKRLALSVNLQTPFSLRSGRDFAKPQHVSAFRQIDGQRKFPDTRSLRCGQVTSQHRQLLTIGIEELYPKGMGIPQLRALQTKRYFQKLSAPRTFGG